MRFLLQIVHSIVWFILFVYFSFFFDSSNPKSIFQIFLPHVDENNSSQITRSSPD